MTARSYRLLCPIARSLDHIGDRWALLVLRDLHAGPARYGELLAGMPGIASNMLASRLAELAEAGLIERTGAEYSLTPLGRHTGNLLYELAAFGSRLPPDPDVRAPGNRRPIAVTLAVAGTRVVSPDTELTLQLLVDGEPFEVRASNGRVDVRARAADSPQVTLATSYEALVAVTDGVMGQQEFALEATITASDPARIPIALSLLSAIVNRIAQDAPEPAALPVPRKPGRAKRRRPPNRTRTRRARRPDRLSS